MAKKNHEKKGHPKGMGVALVGNPDELIKLLISDVATQEHIHDQIINEGPEHKQVLSALLLRRLFKLVKALGKCCDAKFVLQQGSNIVVEKHDVLTEIPVPMPLNVGSKVSKNDIIKSIANAPEHEALLFAMSMQAIEWSIKAAVNRKE